MASPSFLIRVSASSSSRRFLFEFNDRWRSTYNVCGDYLRFLASFDEYHLALLKHAWWSLPQFSWMSYEYNELVVPNWETTVQVFMDFLAIQYIADCITIDTGVCHVVEDGIIKPRFLTCSSQSRKNRPNEPKSPNRSPCPSGSS